MSIDKEEYIESNISLEGKFPEFSLEGPEKSDILVRFSKSDDCKVVSVAEAEEDMGGAVLLHIEEETERLAAIKFEGGAKRWKLERCVRTRNFLEAVRVSS